MSSGYSAAMWASKVPYLYGPDAVRQQDSNIRKDIHFPVENEPSEPSFSNKRWEYKQNCQGGVWLLSDRIEISFEFKMNGLYCIPYG